MIASYREWKHPGDEDSSTKEGISNQVQRINEISNIVDNVNKLKLPIIWSGDLNVDMLKRNDNYHRADVRAVKPIFTDCLGRNNLAVMNKEPTWFRPGKRDSMLDLFILSHPHHCAKIANITNTLSEHAGVTIEVNLNLNTQKKQFITIRNNKNITWVNLEPLIDNNDKLNKVFSETDPDEVAENLLDGLNEVVKELLITKSSNKEGFAPILE